MTYPVRDVVLPAVLAGQPNGKLPASILVATPGAAGGPAVVLVEPAARAWRALYAAAKAAGHTLKSSCDFCSYRPYAEQERIFRARYTTVPNGTTPRIWNGQKWYKRPGVAAAAVPGTSNHGRGLAVDTGEERDGDTGTESMDAGTLAWLVANEQTFGWSHEIQSEPWHVRYFAGDAIPKAVLAYEATNPAPALTARRTPMVIRTAPDGTLHVLAIGTDGKLFHGIAANAAAVATVPLTEIPGDGRGRAISGDFDAAGVLVAIAQGTAANVPNFYAQTRTAGADGVWEGKWSLHPSAKLLA